jgi:GrpB protein
VAHERSGPAGGVGGGASKLTGKVEVVDNDPEWPRLFRLPGDRSLPAAARWLRGHPRELAHYQRVKRELAEPYWTYAQEYADVKTELVEGIIARAAGGADGDAGRDGGSGRRSGRGSGRRSGRRSGRAGRDAG